jgi:hypothetical protein
MHLKIFIFYNDHLVVEWNDMDEKNFWPIIRSWGNFCKMLHENRLWIDFRDLAA